MLDSKNSQGNYKIGILGGTFNPIHYGHLVIAQWAKEGYSLDKVLFIPSGTPPHKLEDKVLEYHHRYLMTVLATLDQASFEVSQIEINRKGPSYTIDTINYLKKMYGSGVKLYFITGADSIFEIYTWNRYKELLGACYFIAATREGYNNEELDEKIKEIHDIYNSKIYKMKVPDLGISSTELRKRIDEGKTIKYLLPSVVEQYISKNKLYKDN